ncbi:MAG: serine protease [Spirulina sp.]
MTVLDGTNSPSNLASYIARTVREIAEEQVPDLANIFPFYHGSCVIEWYLKDNWILFRITSQTTGGINITARSFKQEEIESILPKILPITKRKHQDLLDLLGSQWFSFKKFTYFGLVVDGCVAWNDIAQYLEDWLNHIVVPEVEERNTQRVFRAIPQHPSYDIEQINQCLWVLECEEDCKQGTAFMLDGVGLITCQHVLGSKTQAIDPITSKKYPVEIIEEHKTIDLAILKILNLDESAKKVSSLKRGSADSLKQMDHLAVAGFPNYHLGDSGVMIPGLVVGFRMKSAIRRILTNAPLIAGNSGSPVLSYNNLVIGVAVTGAERMEEAQETEEHGIIPIDALDYLLTN